MSQLTRGIFGRKPTTSGSSDVFSLSNQYSASTTGTWPSSTSSTGLVIAEDFVYTDIGIGTYTKMSNGLYYPETFIDYAPAATYGYFSAVQGLSVSKGGNYVAVIVTTQINPTIQNLFIWKKPAAGYPARWQYLTALTSANSTYPYVVEFHPSGNYIVYGNNGTASIVLHSRSGDTFNNVSTTTIGGGNTIISAMAWNPDGTTLAVGTTLSPYITFYNFSGGTFTALPSPATLPPAAVNSIAWNHDGTSVAMQINSTVTPMIIYNRSVNTFTAIGGISGIRASSYNAGQMSWNNTGTLLAIVDRLNNGSIVVWSRSGDSFTSVSVPAPLNSSENYLQAQFSPNGTELAVTSNSTLDIWVVNGTSITRSAISPFGGYTGRCQAAVSTYIYGSRMGTTYGSDTITTTSPTRWLRWIPPA